MSLPSRCLETDCITSFYFYVRVSRSVYIEGIYYSLPVKEVAKFHFRTNKQFMNCVRYGCVVDLEQWPGFKGAVSGCLSYRHDTKLRGVKWSAEAGT
jgi:hypothetical protein